MAEDAWSKLKRLEEESQVFQKRRQSYYYESETPGCLDEHNRQIKIRKIRQHFDPPEWDGGDDWEGIFPGIKRPRFF